MGLFEDFDPEKVLRKALKNGGELSEIYAEDTSTTSIVLEEDKIENILGGRDRGCGIRVIAGLKTFYAYTNSINEASLLELAEMVSAAVKNGQDRGDVHLKGKEVAPGFKIITPPGDVSLNDKVELTKRGNSAMRGFDKRIIQAKVVYGDAFKKMATVNSLGDWAEEDKSSIIYICQAVAMDGEVIQTGYEPLGGLLGLEVFNDNPPEKIAEAAAKRAVMMLSARKAPGGRMSVILSSEAGGTMIHEAVGHGLEADLAGEGLSVYKGKLGEQVASELITVIDDGTIDNKRGSGFFDSEATHTQKTVLVENGILKSYMYDRLSAMKMGAKSTGNGRRESYQHRPIPRMTNTMIAPGKSDPKDVVSSIENGLYVKKMGGGQVNTVNGDFVFEVTEGYMVENGEIGEPVRGATLTGNGPKVLNEIDMVASDLGFGIGTCGKDGQGVPVADAQPTLRIPEITVGGAV